MNMATINHIKQITVGGDNYELLAKYMSDVDGTGHTWEEIEAMVGAGLQLVTDTANEAGDPSTAASAKTMGKIYLVPTGAISGTHVEFITIQTEKGFVWEQIGTTATDLTNYAKKGTKTSSNNGAHSHTVTGHVTVPTVAKTTGTMGVTITPVSVSGSGTASVMTDLGNASTGSAMGSNAEMSISGDLTKVHLKATASGATVGANGTASAITDLGDASTASVVTGYAAPSKATVLTGLGKATTGSAMGSGAEMSISGDVATTAIKATASGTAVSAPTATFVKSYPGATSKMNTTTIKGVGGTASVVKSASMSGGALPNWSASVVDGVLSFDFSKGSFQTLSAPTTTVATAASADTTVATGTLSGAGTGSAVMTGLGTPSTGSAVTSASISAQPTIKIAAGSGAGSYTVATGKGTLGVSVDNAHEVTAVTDYTAPTTTSAITGLGVASTTSVVTGYAAPSKATVLTGVKVTAQPTVKLTAAEKAVVGTTMEVATNKGNIDVSVDNAHTVTAVTGYAAPSKATVLTGVKVTAQPTVALDPAAIDGIDFVKTITIGSKSENLAGGKAKSDGAHTHSVEI